MRTTTLLQRASATMSELVRDGEVGPRAGGREDLVLLNYDDRAAYAVTARVEDDGEPAFEETYRLAPGATRRVGETADPGRYDITIDAGGTVRELADCQLGGPAGQTVVVEAGNGVVSAATGAPRAAPVGSVRERNVDL